MSSDRPCPHVLFAFLLASCPAPLAAQEGERLPLLGPVPIPLSRMTTAGSSPEEWRVHRDGETGFTFRHPASWSVKPANDRWILTPATGASEPEEGTYFLVGEETPDLRRIDDPTVLSLLDRRAKQLLPGAAREGKVEVARRGSEQSMSLRWNVTREGASHRVQLWAWFARGHVVCLCAVGPAASLERRTAELTTMFGSFAFEETRRDPRLCGTWKTTSYTFGTDFNRYLILTQQGSCFQATTLDSDFVPGPANAEDRGSWELRGETLALRWQKDGLQRGEVSHEVTEFGTFLHFAGERWEKVR